MLFARRDIEAAGAGAGQDDSPAAKKGKPDAAAAASAALARPTLTRTEALAAAAVLALFVAGIFCIFLAASSARSSASRAASPTCASSRTILLCMQVSIRQILCWGGVLVVFTATAGASSCYFLSKLIGRPLVCWLWPERLRYFQSEIAKRKDKLLNYMLFLRITPTLPNTFINMASPIVDIPFHIFFAATLIGLIPASYITVKAGRALGDLRSVRELYDFKTLVVLFLIGSVAVVPTILKRKRTYE